MRERGADRLDARRNRFSLSTRLFALDPDYCVSSRLQYRKPCAEMTPVPCRRARKRTLEKVRTLRWRVYNTRPHACWRGRRREQRRMEGVGESLPVLRTGTTVDSPRPNRGNFRTSWVSANAFSAKKRLRVSASDPSTPLSLVSRGETKRARKNPHRDPAQSSADSPPLAIARLAPRLPIPDVLPPDLEPRGARFAPEAPPVERPAERGEREGFGGVGGRVADCAQGRPGGGERG